MDRCEPCGFVYAEVALDEVGARIRALPNDYVPAVTAAEAEGLARTRPAPATWSALEYTCHVRDVLHVQHERLRSALVEDVPTFASMQRDERVVRDRYNDQDVEVVLAQLAAAAMSFADHLERMSPDDWERTGIYNWPQRAERTMAWLAVHTLHEGVHHLADVVDVVAEVRAARQA